MQVLFTKLQKLFNEKQKETKNLFKKQIYKKMFVKHTNL